MSNTDTYTDDLVQQPQQGPQPPVNDPVQRQPQPPRNFLGNNLSPTLSSLSLPSEEERWRQPTQPPQPPQQAQPLQQPLMSPPPQGLPPPQWPPVFRPNRRQAFIPSQANRPPQDWGKDPAFPQLPDMWEVPGVYRGLAQQLARFGSYRTGLMAANLGRMTDAYQKGLTRGQRDYSRLRHQQMVGAADELQKTMQEELTGYGTLYGGYAGNPTQMHDQLMNKALEFGDREMQAALNVSPQAAERLLQWRQAKYDDLHRSNRARREFDENLRARNPFMINPVGPDGLPTERLPLPFDTKPQPLPRLAAAGPGTGMDPNDPDSAEYDDQIVESPPPPDYDPNRPIGDTGQNQPARAGAPPQNLPFKPSPQWPDQPPDPDREGAPRPKDRPVNPGLDLHGEDRPWPIPQEPEKNYPPRRRRDVPYDKAEQQGGVQLAQADTGTATDAPTLPQITVKPDDQGDQPEEDQDGRTVWDDVRLRSQLRQAREGAGRAGGGPSPQPPDQAGAGQPGQQGPQPQAQPAARGGGPGGQGGQPGAVPQAPAQVPAAAAAASAAQPTPQGQEQPPLRMTPALTQAQTQGLKPDEINNMAQRHFFGDMTATEYKSLRPEIRNAITARDAEMQGELGSILQRGITGDAVFDEVAKISPVWAENMRAIKAGVSAPPKKGPTALIRSLMFKADPTFTDSTYKNRSDAMKNYTSGPASRNLTSAGTAVRHADRLLHNLENAPYAVQELLYKGLPLSVVARMPGMTETVRKMQEMDLDADTLGSEYATALASGSGGRGATGPERKEQAKKIDIYAPTAAIDRVREMKVELGARVQQLKQQFEADTGMSFDSIKGKFDIPGINELLQMDVAKERAAGGKAIPYDEYFK